LIGLAAGGVLPRHQTASPVTIHVLEGRIALDIDGATQALKAGELAALEAGVPHSVHAPDGAFVLLTIAQNLRPDVRAENELR
jgi:quercetin dioxygenase-like cupin family protein